MTDPRQVPPSFTPSGHPGRPPEAGDAIPVQGARGGRPAGGRIGRPDDAVPAASEPRVRRQSSREVPTSTPENRGTPVRRPRAYPPAGGAQSGRAPARDGGTRVAPGAAVPRRVTGTAAAARPSGPRPGAARPAPRPAQGGGIRVRKGRVAALLVALLLVLVLAWPVGLLIWANGKIEHIDALSGAAGTPGTTYLIAGSDRRGSGGIDDHVSGARTDTLMLLHKPASGPAALISIPRDTFAKIPGHGSNKINAAYAYGGAPLLVKAVEQLSGLTVDHYVEVGFGGMEDVVDAVGGVRLCLDRDVDDRRSELHWTSGCHVVDGKTALAFSRMRYSDPKGDIGRAERQRQVIAAISGKLNDKALIFQPTKQVALASAGLGALTVDQDSNILNLGQLGLAFRAANGPGGVTGTPPIKSLNYRGGNGSGSSVLLDPDKSPTFWRDLAAGTLKPGTVGGI